MDSVEAIKTLYHNHVQRRDTGTQTDVEDGPRGGEPEVDGATARSPEAELSAQLSSAELDTGSCSDELEFGRPCDVCNASGKRGAIGFCVQCEQYLCRVCCCHHKKIAATKQHEVTMDDSNKDTDTLFGRKVMPVSVFPCTPASLPGLSNASSIKLISICFVNDGKDIVALIKSEFRKGKGTTSIFLVENGMEAKILITTEGIRSVTSLRSDPKRFIAIHEHTAPKATISIIDVSNNQYSQVNAIDLSGECTAISEFGEGYAALLKMNTGMNVPVWQLQYLTTDGEVERRICYNDGKAMFSHPISLAANDDNTILYVIDDKKVSNANVGTITGFNLTADVLFTFTNKDLLSSTSISVDKEDNIMVGVGEAVWHVNKTRTKTAKLLESQYLCGIKQVAFNRNRSLLAVADVRQTIQILTFV